MENNTPNCTQVLPEGHREILSVDLQQDKKLAVVINSLSLVSLLLLAPIGFLIVPFRELFDFSRGLGPYLLRLGVLLVSLMAYVVLHELTHAAVMKGYGAQKLRFGYTGLYAFAGSEGDYFGKRAYRHIALAPLTVWTLVFAVLSALVPRDWFWVVWVLLIMNISGAAGDVYVTLRFLKLPGDILVNDTGVAMKVYSAE